MNMKRALEFYLNEPGKVWVYGIIPLFGIVALWCLLIGQCSIFTPDQIGYRLFRDSRYEEAAPRFGDPLWKAAAHYRAAEFREAAGIYGGFDTGPAAFNHGNSLVMLGKYEDAIKRYDRALELRPGWQEAEANRQIAVLRAEMVKKEGGAMTGGQLEADEIVFDQGKSPAQGDEETGEETVQMSDAEMRAVWLKNVQTRPADFLRSKFAYQHAVAGQAGDHDGSAD